MSLGEKLKHLRVKKRKTLNEHGKILKVSMNTVHRWENDLTVPRKQALKAMADYHDVPVDWLLSDCASSSLVSEIEQKLLDMFRQLPDNNRHKVLGFVERMYAE